MYRKYWAQRFILPDRRSFRQRLVQKQELLPAPYCSSQSHLVQMYYSLQHAIQNRQEGRVVWRHIGFASRQGKATDNFKIIIEDVYPFHPDSINW